MRSPVPGLRSLALMRAGVAGPKSVAEPSHPSPSAGATVRSTRWIYLLPLLFLAVLAACDGASPTEPEAAGAATPSREAPNGKPDRPVHRVHAAPAQPRAE